MSKKLWASVLLLILSIVVGGVAAQDQDGLLRVAHLSPDIEDLDIYVDGERLLEDVFSGVMSEHLRLQPGTHTVALVPAGESLRNTLVGPLRVNIIGGHSHIVAVIGLMEDDSLTSVTIDETDAFEAANLDPRGEQSIILHGFSGLGSISVSFNGQTVIEDLDFGDYQAVNIPVDLFTVVFEENNIRGAQPLIESETFGFPNNTSLLALMPSRGGVSMFVSNYSPLNIVDYLNGYSDHTEINFNIFMEAVEEIGLTDTLSTGEGFTIFLPSDDAFNRLPDDTLDDLLNDRNALRRLVNYHIVPQLLTFDDIVNLLIETNGEDIRLTTLQGTDLTLGINQNAGLLINGSVGFESFTDYLASNGNAFIIDGILSVSGSPGNTVSLPRLIGF